MYSLSAISVVSQQSVSRFVNVLWIFPLCSLSRCVFSYWSINAQDVQIYKHMHYELVELLAVIPSATHTFSCSEASLI